MDRSRKGSAKLMSLMGIVGRGAGRGWGSQRGDATQALGSVGAAWGWRKQQCCSARAVLNSTDVSRCALLHRLVLAANTHQGDVIQPGKTGDSHIFIGFQRNVP